jgi:hypothetical protein
MGRYKRLSVCESDNVFAGAMRISEGISDCYFSESRVVIARIISRMQAQTKLSRVFGIEIGLRRLT